MESKFCPVDIRRWLGKSVRLAQAVGRVLFPHFCLSCGLEGALLCQQCEMRRTLNRGVLFSLGSTRCFSAGQYADQILRGLLHLYKYGRVEEAGQILVRIAVGCAGRQSTAVLGGLDDPIVIPLPMNPVNQALRGFNQTELLASALAIDFELELAKKVVKRRFAWRPQAHLSGVQCRTANVRSAFVSGDSNLNGRDVILVDDVFTTGATINECLSALRQAGAGRVGVFTALKG